MPCLETEVVVGAERSVRCIPSLADFFFVFYMAIMRWVLISIFVAIILEYFNDSNAEEVPTCPLLASPLFLASPLHLALPLGKPTPLKHPSSLHSHPTPHFPKGVSIKYDDIESFQRKWLEFDVRSTSYIRTVDLGLLLYACSNNHAEAQTLRETH